MEKDKGYNILIEWAKKQDYYVKVLLGKLFCNEKTGDSCYEQIVSDYINKEFKALNFDIQISQNKQLRINKISNIIGVNKLNSAEIMELHDKLTLIFGNNGTGKTGYSRIFKSIGDSFDSSLRILGNIEKAEEINPSAKVEYTLEEDLMELQWNNTQNNVLPLRVFDTNDITLCLGKSRNPVVQPKIFTLTQNLVTEIKNFKSYVDTKISNIKASVPNIINIIQGTKAFDFIVKVQKGISDETLQKELENLLNNQAVNDIEKLIAENKEKGKEILNTTITKEYSKCKGYCDYINKVINKITLKDAILYSKSTWNHLSTYKEDVAVFELQDSVRESIVNKFNLSNNKKRALIEMIDSVFNYGNIKKDNVKKIEKCAVCGQELDVQAKELYEKYSKLHSEDLSSKLKKAKEVLNKHKSLIEKEKDIIISMKESTDESVEILEINNDINLLIEQVNKLIINPKDINEIDSIVLSLKTKETTLKEKLAKLSLDEGKIVENISKNRELLSELQSMLIICENKDKIVETGKKLYILVSIGNINTSSLAKCQKRIMEESFSEEYANKVNEYFTKLKVPNILKFQSKITGGKIGIQQTCNNHEVSSIFSDGEKTAAALAEFFAECKLSESSTTIVFDDIVNSLDLDRMALVAKEIVELTKSHQVVLFTHNTLFYSYINIYLKKNSIKSKFLHLSKSLNGLVGNIEENAVPNDRTLKNTIKEINNMLNSGKLSEDNVKSLYGKLRVALELFIAERLLNDTIRRYEHEIKVGSFLNIDLIKVNSVKKELEEIYNETSKFLEGHSSSPHSATSPDITEFMNLYDKFKCIKQKFN